MRDAATDRGAGAARRAVRPLAVAVAVAIAAGCRGPSDPFPLTTVVPEQPRADVPAGGIVTGAAFIPGSRDVVFAAAPSTGAAAGPIALYRAVVDAGNHLTGDVLPFATLPLPDGVSSASIVPPERIHIAASDVAERIVVTAAVPPMPAGPTAASAGGASRDRAAGGGWRTVFWRLDPSGAVEGGGVLPPLANRDPDQGETADDVVHRLDLGPRSRAIVVHAGGGIDLVDLSGDGRADPLAIGETAAPDAVSVAWNAAGDRAALGYASPDGDGAALSVVDVSSRTVAWVPVPARPIPWFTPAGRLRVAVAVDASTTARPGMVLGADGQPEARIAVAELDPGGDLDRLELDWPAALAPPSPDGLTAQRTLWLAACPAGADAPGASATTTATLGDTLLVATSATSATSAAAQARSANAQPSFQGVYRLTGDLVAAPAAARAELVLPDAVDASAALASCARGALVWPIGSRAGGALADVAPSPAPSAPFRVADARPWRRQQGGALVAAADAPSVRAACVVGAEHDVLFLAVGFAPRIYRARTAGPPTYALTGQLALFATLAERGFAHTADGWPTEPYPAIGPLACGPDGHVAAVLAMWPPPDLEPGFGDSLDGAIDAPPPPLSQELILFNADGVIERRAAVEASPLGEATDVAGRSDADRFGADAIVELLWSPDGRHVAARRASGWVEVWAVPAFSFTRVVRVLPPLAVGAAASAPPIIWSPNGRSLAVVGRRVDGDGPPPAATVHLFAVDADGISSPGAFGGQGLATWAWFAEDGSALRYLEWGVYGPGDAGTGGNLVASSVDLAVQPLAARPLRAPLPVADSSELPVHAFAHDGVDWLVVPGGLAVLHDPTGAVPDAARLVPTDALRWGRLAHQHGTTGLLAADPLSRLLILRPDGLEPFDAGAGGGVLPADPRRLVVVAPLPRRADAAAAAEW